MDYLASVTDLQVFGCSIDFLQTATQTYLEDLIWDRLQQDMAYTVVFKDSSAILPSQKQLEGCSIHHVVHSWVSDSAPLRFYATALFWQVASMSFT